MRASIAAAAALLLAAGAAAYPIDGNEQTGISRLIAYDLARDGLLARGTLKPGSLLPRVSVRPRLLHRLDLELPPPDPAFTREIAAMLGKDGRSYSVSVLDLSDPDAPLFADHNGDRTQNPGSVGKIAVLLAWFQALADVYPDDIPDRQEVLREAMITADAFIRRDGHVVPIWAPGDPKVLWRPIQEGDRANVWTYLDWMASASSNAAASTLMEHLMLLVHFGDDYPVSAEKAAAFFSETPKTELQKIFLDAIQKPLTRNGLDVQKLRQGSFFTREGKRRVPGTNSVATSRELLRFLLLLEEGKLVDSWSSTEIKRLLYLTDTRIRYASHPALDNAAVYFKSGSLYGCVEEAGFQCGKYIGNRINFMNSIAIVEEERDGKRLHYIVVVLSNVLRKNSAEAHQAMAQKIHQLIELRHGAAPDAPTLDDEIDAPAETQPMRTSRR